MSAGCCNIGATELETLRKTLAWESSWAEHITQELMIARNAITKMAGYGIVNEMHFNHEGMTRESALLELDTLMVMLGALARRMAAAHSDDEDNDVLQQLVAQFADAKKMANGEKPIRLWGLEWEFKNHMDKGLLEEVTEGDCWIHCIEGNRDYWTRKSLPDYKKEILGFLDSSHLKNLAKESVILVLVFQDRESLMNMLRLEKETVAEGGTGFLANLKDQFKGIKFLYRHDCISELDVAVAEKEIAEAGIKI